MRKLAFVLTALITTVSKTFAYHGTEQSSGGAALPVYETTQGNILYLLLPLFAYTYLLNELMQYYFERRYSDTSLKDAEDLMSYTVVASLATTFMLLFTRAFHSLPDLSLTAYATVIGLVLISATALKNKEKIRELIE